jgi:hypothetical protein
MIELAVAIPIVILLIVGVADYARIYYTAITVTNAAQAGANFGVQPTWGPTEMIAGARADAAPMTLDSVTAGRYCRCPGVGVVDCLAGNCAGGYGTPQVFDSVRIRKDVATIIHYPGLPATITIIRKAVIRTK